ncbi:MAG TPA: serine/threonine-protein kinase [Nostocaceae cyanobacterium]|nr:serine/threonine-protein kinase [Nostocaceae cyanobacterium]
MSQIAQSAVHCINPECQRPYPQPWGHKFCSSCGSPLQLLDRYHPIQPLGSGGFAQIYTVWDERTQTEKVLKVLIESSAKALELFTQEAEVLQTFQHSGVPKVAADGFFQINIVNPKPRQLACLVMEKINGQTLEEVLRSYPQGCPEDLVIKWSMQVVEILQELHKRQIIHRDIKPSNLMLRYSSPTATHQANQLVLIDFGGAKQFTGAILKSRASSTRLFSSGYSPPEQVTGGNVGPAADFYALGRTMIHLLTGKYPQELEDPVTGELRWRKWRTVNLKLADLIDEMVQENVRSRPAHAAVIYKRLQKLAPLPINIISQLGQATNQASTTLTQQVNQQVNHFSRSIEQAVMDFAQFVGRTTLFTVQAIFTFIFACLTTIWAMIVSAVFAISGTMIGFYLAYKTNLGDRITEWISNQLPQLLPNNQPYLAPEIIVFAMAGFGTAWGLTLSGCFGQKRRFLIASAVAMLGYSLGWVIWQFITPQTSPDGLIVWMLISIPILTLGLGLRSHYLAYACIAALGSAIIASGLIRLGLPAPIFHFSTQPAWFELLLPIAFFGFVGMLISFCLSVSYYVIVPWLRWLGWR